MSVQINFFESDLHEEKGSQVKAGIVPKYRLEMIMEAGSDYGKISCSSRAQTVFKQFGLHRNAEEVLAMVTLDSQNNIMGYFEVSRGNLTSSIASPREVFKRAIVSNAQSIIVAHNHPGGSLDVSSGDKKVTKTLKKAGELLGIALHDHIIIAPNGKTISFAEKGLL